MRATLTGLALLALSILALEATVGVIRVPSFAEVRAAYRPSDGALVDRRGEVLQEIRLDPTIRRLDWISLREISPAVVEALVAGEDRRFYAHRGVDARALAAAFVSWVGGGPRRGASTITMQVASLIGKPRPPRTGRRSLGEKLWQMRTAMALEARWSKAEILEAYLNLVSLRGEIEGIAAASSVLYGKVPHGLDRAEAIVLASLVRSPNARPATLARRAHALAATLDTPPTDAELDAAIAKASRPPAGSGPRLALAPHAAARLRGSFGGAAVLSTTLDADIQRLAVDVLRRQIVAVRERHVSDGAVLVADNRTGEVLAYVGGSGELGSAAEVDGVQAPRQAGSALKPFLYGRAFEERLLTPASLLEDMPLEVPGPRGLYRPENYDHEFRGLVSARTALAGSLNVPAVRTALLVGVDHFAATLRTLGFARVVEDGDYYGPALALGSVEVTLWELTAAYRALANGGVWSPLGLRPDVARGESRRVYSAATAFLLTSILADRDSRSTTFGLENPLATPFWTAVKTGTSKDMRDNWCVGFSRRYTVGVWVGNFSGEPMRDVTGITGAAPVWLEILSALHEPTERSPAPPPSGLVEKVANFPGGVEPAREEWFLGGTEPSGESVPALAARPRIVSPTAGSVVARDPDIPPSRQRLVFESAAATTDLGWRLDGRALGSAARPLPWQPRPGAHVLELVDRRQRALDRVQFTVREGD